MTRAVHRAGFRPLAFASRQLLLRPAALKIAASIVLTLLALGLYSLSRGSYPLPASTLARALLAPQEMGEQPRFILFDIRLPRILMALLAVAFCWALPGAIILFCTARAADVALLGDRTAIGLGVRLQQLTVLRFFAPVLLTSASVSCVGSLGFVGLMAPHMARFVLRGGQVSLLCGSALIGALLVLATDTLGRLAFAPLQIPAGIVIALVGCPFFVILLWRRRDAL
ncbi:TPA: iron chelate uptake ABC transporter family permease subunit [Klebsiella pneumoniae]|nr:iron chelate uptake ABC transporter family permease subunit [Klebsiella pneumoniae]